MCVTLSHPERLGGFTNMVPTTGVKESSSSQASSIVLDTKRIAILITRFTAYAATLSFCIANWMLLLRVSALYGHDRYIFRGLTIFWIVSYIASITTMSIASKELHGEQ